MWVNICTSCVQNRLLHQGCCCRECYAEPRTLRNLLPKCAFDLSADVQDAGFWQQRFGVQRAPALVFLRGPGVAPAVFDTSNSKRLDVGKLASDNQWQVSMTFFTFQSQQL